MHGFLVAVGGLILLGLVVRRNPDSAAEQSELFHGEPGEVGHLSPSERHRPPAEVVTIGKAVSITYEPPPESDKAGALYEHKFGDRGPFAAASNRKPELVADPESERIYLVGGDVKFDPAHGLMA